MFSETREQIIHNPEQFNKEELEALPLSFEIITFSGKSLNDYRNRFIDTSNNSKTFLDRYPQFSTERTTKDAQIAIPTMSSFKRFFNTPNANEITHIDSIATKSLSELEAKARPYRGKFKYDLMTAAEAVEAYFQFYDKYGESWLDELEKINAPMFSATESRTTRVLITTNEGLAGLIPLPKDVENRHANIVPIIRPRSAAIRFQRR